MAISYSGSPYFSTASLTTATVTNTAPITGGVYSSTSGLSINATTGEINLIASTPGTYTVTYTVNSTAVTTSIVVNHSFANVLDLYNQTLLLDKSYVDTIVAAIKATIFTRITNQQDPWFDYDSQPVLGALQPIQQYRIKDQVVVQLRNMGIRDRLSPNYVAAIIYPTIPQETSYIMGISWIIRDAREYMKTYV